MRVLLLVNSTASSVTPHKRALIRRILASQHDVEVAETSRRGHATLLARAAAEDDFDVVAVLAGDGTLNEAAAGLLHTRTALAPLPGGSTNVYSQTLRYPRRAGDAAQALVDALEVHAIRRVGIGMVNEGMVNGGMVNGGAESERPFLFCAGIGFDASVVRRVERHSRRVKRLASHPLHVAAAFHSFFSAEGRRTHVNVAVPGGPELQNVRFAIISKSTPYTYLGRLPLNIARNASIDTRISVTAFTKLRALTLLGGAASSTRTGKFLASRKDVTTIDDLGALRIHADAPFPYQLDGDDAGDTKELNVAFVPDALAIVIPRISRPRTQ
jgi:diacylglycerol kinase family enzyme